MPAIDPLVAKRLDRARVVRPGERPRASRRFRERDGQPFGLDHLVVVPLGAAGQALRPNAGEQLQRRGARLSRGSRQMQLRLDAVVAMPPEPPVDPERRAQRERGSSSHDR